MKVVEGGVKIEEGVEGVGYNKVMVGRDGDVEGMEMGVVMIRLLVELLGEVIKKGDVYILERGVLGVGKGKKGV